MVSCADKIMRLTIDTYFEPNRTIGKLRDLIKSETNIDPLKEFSELAAPNWKHSFRDRVSLESFAHASDLAPRSVLIGGLLTCHKRCRNYPKLASVFLKRIRETPKNAAVMTARAASCGHTMSKPAAR